MTTKKPAARAKGTTAKAQKGDGALTLSPSHADIAQRAFALYLARGGDEGDDMRDWLRAERELRGQA